MKGLPKDAQNYVNIIYKSGKRMHRLVSKINLLCQLKGGVELFEGEAMCWRRVEKKHRK